MFIGTVAFRGVDMAWQGHRYGLRAENVDMMGKPISGGFIKQIVFKPHAWHSTW